MQPTPPEESRPTRRTPAHFTRRRKRGRPRHRSRVPQVLMLVLLCGVMLGVAWKVFHISNRLPNKDTFERTRRDRVALVAEINKQLAQTGKNVPVADVVVNSAIFRDRDGDRYLTGTVHNKSQTSYSTLHLSFDTYDSHHNRAGIVEGDVLHLAAGEEAPFEIGPTNPRARYCSLQSIREAK